MSGNQTYIAVDVDSQKGPGMCSLPAIVRGAVRRLVMAACALVVCLCSTQPLAAQATVPPPVPDPAGIATGDRTSVADAGGNAFVIAEPTDSAAADYSEKKKA